MPVEARRFVKAALVWFVAGFFIGAAMLSSKALGYPAPQWLSVVHAHALFVGWLVNMVCGFALWMLPLDRTRFPDTKGRYSPVVVGLSFALLNGGLVLRFAAEPFVDQTGPTPVLAGLLLLSAAAQLTAVILFVVTAWTRVRPPSAPPPGVR